MDTINYLKIQSLIHSIIVDKLKLIFKERWSIVGRGKWSNNVSNGTFIINNHQDQLQHYSSTDKYSAQSGDLNRFNFNILSDLLLNFKPFNQQDQHQQNNIIQSILNIHNSIDKEESTKLYILDNDKYQQYREQLVGYLVLLSSSTVVTPPSDNNKDISNEIKEEVKFKLDTLQDSKQPPKSIVINEEIEKQVSYIKEVGNKHYSKSNYCEAASAYKDILKLEGLSTLTKSIIHSNLSTNYYARNSSLTSTEGAFIPDHQDYFVLRDSEEHAYLSIINRPTWTKSILRLAKIKSKLSQYQVSINLCNAALYLNDPSLKEEAETLKTNSIQLNQGVIYKQPKQQQQQQEEENINYSTTATATATATTKRDYRKEAEFRLQQLGNIVDEHFKDSKITNELLINEGILNDQNSSKELKMKSKFYGVPLNRIIEREVTRVGSNYINQGSLKKGLKLLSAAVGENTDHAIAHVLLSEHVRFGKGIKPNNALYVSLLLKASLLPPSFEVKRLLSSKPSKDPKKFESALYKDKMVQDNYGVIRAWSALGLIYRSGLHGESIDLEKSVYYFNKSIKYDDELNYEIYKNDGFSYLCLGYMHFKGTTRYNESNINEDITKKLWLQGAKLGSVECYDRLLSNFKSQQDYEDFKDLKRPKRNLSSSQLYESEQTMDNLKKKNGNLDNMGGRELPGLTNNTLDSYKTQQPLDFEQIEIHANNGSGYAKLIIETNSKLNQFLNSFNQYTTQKHQLEQHSTFDSNSYIINNGVKVIQQLSEAYTKYLDLYFVVRIPGPIIHSVKELVNSIIKLVPNNVHAKICYLSLNRFNGKYKENYKFVNDAIQIHSRGSSSSNSNRGSPNSSSPGVGISTSELMALYYFRCANAQYLNLLMDISESYAYGIRNSETPFQKAAFQYYLYNTNCLFGHPKPNTPIPPPLKEELLQLEHDLPSDHPYKSLLNFQMAAFLCRIGSIGYHKTQILEYYNKAIQFIPQLKLEIEMDIISQYQEIAEGHMKLANLL